MSKLISNYANAEISNEVKDNLRMYQISSWNFEPYHQNQYPPEGRYGVIKGLTNTVMNRTGAPPECWLLCMIHVCYPGQPHGIQGPGWCCSPPRLYDISPDSSMLLLHIFYQQVSYAAYNQPYPSVSEERAAYWVGLGEYIGAAITHKLNDADT